MSEYSCPECGRSLVKCPYPDYKGHPWFYCEVEDTYHHESELIALINLADAQHAVDVLSSFDGPLPELTGALSEERLCEQRLRDLTTITVPQTAQQ